MDALFLLTPTAASSASPLPPSSSLRALIDAKTAELDAFYRQQTAAECSARDSLFAAREAELLARAERAEAHCEQAVRAATALASDALASFRAVEEQLEKEREAAHAALASLRRELDEANAARSRAEADAASASAAAAQGFAGGAQLAQLRADVAALRTVIRQAPVVPPLRSEFRFRAGQQQSCEALCAAERAVEESLAADEQEVALRYSAKDAAARRLAVPARRAQGERGRGDRLGARDALERAVREVAAMAAAGDEGWRRRG